MKPLLSMLAAMTFFATAPLAHAQTAAMVAKAVDNHYNRLQSLQAHYTERYQGMGIDRSETGMLTLRKPGRMRWAYDSPAGKIFILDGHDAIAYTPGDAQATRIPEKQLDDLRSPLRFLLGHTELAKELDDLTLLPSNQHPGDYALSGVPKGMQQRVHRLTLTVDAKGVIEDMRIEETDGAVTTFTFTDIRDNVPTADADFTFIPPPGVAIVKGTGPI